MRLFIVFVLLPVAFIRAQNDSASVHEVAEAVRAGHYQEAISLADRSLQTNPEDFRLLTLRALALAKTGDTNGALAAYDSALKVNPAYIPALAGASELEYRTGNESALKHVDALLKLRPDDQTAHAMRGFLSWKRNDCASAVQHFSAAPAAISQQPAALQEYGICLVRQKRLPEAIQVFERLHALEPADLHSLLALVSAELIAGRDSEALARISPALENGDTDPQVLRTASDIQERVGNTPAAVALLRRAIVSAPDREELYVDFSSLSFEHNSFQVGVDMLNAGLVRLPKSAKLHLARGVLEAQMGEYAQADDDFAAAERLDPSEMSGRGAQALARFQSDRLDEALASVRDSLEKQPKDPFLHYLEAEILLRRGAQPGSVEFKHAFEAARKAVELKPDFTLARDVLSRLYLESGDAASAIRECRAALATDPYDQMALYRLIRALKSSKSPQAVQIPELTRQLAKARERAQQQESEANRYRLVEASADSAQKQPGR